MVLTASRVAPVFIVGITGQIGTAFLEMNMTSNNDAMTNPTDSDVMPDEIRAKRGQFDTIRGAWGSGVWDDGLGTEYTRTESINKTHTSNELVDELIRAATKFQRESLSHNQSGYAMPRLIYLDARDALTEAIKAIEQERGEG